MTEPPPSAPVRAVTSDRLILLVFFVVLAAAAVLCAVITYGPWGGDKTVQLRAQYVCWGFAGLILLLGVIVYAFTSPYVGRIKASAFGAEIDLEGKGGGQ